MSKKLLVGLATGLFIFGIICIAGATSYNAFNDFNPENNTTSNIWQYGETDTLGGEFSLFNNKVSVLITPPGEAVMWENLRIYPHDSPEVIKNLTGNDATINWDPNIRLPGSDFLHFHPGSGCEFGIIRWVCPASGDYQIDSTFKSLRVYYWLGLGTRPTTTDIHVLHNSTSVYDSYINGFIESGDNTFSTALYLEEGDTIDFAVGCGDNNHYLFDSTGLKAVITIANLPPTADAGDDQAIRVGDTVSLDGSGSFDDNTESEDLDYAWMLTFIPIGSTATLSNADTAMPSFVADVAGTYTVELVVTDEDGLSSAPSEVEISSDNLAPTADAGKDQLVITGTSVALDGSGSKDPEFDPMTYAWSVNSAPAGSVATITDNTMEMASFTPDIDGSYELRLEVSDLIGAGTPDTVQITATTAEGVAEAKIMCASDIVSALSNEQVTTQGNKNAFLNFLSQAVAEIQKGNLDKAIDKVEKSIERTNGCSIDGEPDGNGPGRDWITDCAAQEDILICLNEALDALSSQ